MTGARTGHAGTLDPFATGLLLLLSGRATKLASCLVGLDKRYVTEIDLTARTSTGDPEGEVVERHAPPARTRSNGRLERLRGEIELPIPAASAVKIGGERAYRLARRGVEVEMPVRRSTVHALDVIAYTGETVTLDLRVSSGTYVRIACDRARRALHDVAADGGRPVLAWTMLSRRSRSRPSGCWRRLGGAGASRSRALRGSGA